MADLKKKKIAAIAAVNAYLQDEEAAALKRPKLFWFNLLLTVGVIHGQRQCLLGPPGRGLP